MLSLKTGWMDPQQVPPLPHRPYTLLVRAKVSGGWKIFHKESWTLSEDGTHFTCKEESVPLESVYAYHKAVSAYYDELPDIQFKHLIDWETTVSEHKCPLCGSNLELTNEFVQCSGPGCWSGPSARTEELMVIGAEESLGIIIKRAYKPTRGNPKEPLKKKVIDYDMTVANSRCGRCGRALSLRASVEDDDMPDADQLFLVACSTEGCWEGPLRDTRQGAVEGAEALLRAPFKQYLRLPEEVPSMVFDLEDEEVSDMLTEEDPSMGLVEGLISQVRCLRCNRPLKLRKLGKFSRIECGTKGCLVRTPKLRGDS